MSVHQVVITGKLDTGTGIITFDQQNGVIWDQTFGNYKGNHSVQDRRHIYVGTHDTQSNAVVCIMDDTTAIEWAPKKNVAGTIPITINCQQDTGNANVEITSVIYDNNVNGKRNGKNTNFQRVQVINIGLEQGGSGPDCFVDCTGVEWCP